MPSMAIACNCSCIVSLSRWRERVGVRVAHAIHGHRLQLLLHCLPLPLAGTRMAWVPCVPWPSPAIAPALYRPSLNKIRMAWVPSHGHRLQLLLHCRHTGHPWPSPAIAPALQAYRPSMAIKNPGACTPGPSIQTLTLLSSGDAWSPGRSWRALPAVAGGSSSTAHRVRQELPRPSRPRRSELLSPCRHRR
jgi:hypothetical protein